MGGPPPEKKNGTANATEGGNATAPAEGKKEEGEAKPKADAAPASLAQKLSVQAKAQALYNKVELYCKCMRSKNLVQRKGDGTSNTAVTDAMCKPVDGVKGVDCSLNGLNVTVEALKNIVTDKPTPLTVPLTYPYPYTPVAVIPVAVPVEKDKLLDNKDKKAKKEEKPAKDSFIQFTGDKGEEPDEEKPPAPKETANSA